MKKNKKKSIKFFLGGGILLLILGGFLVIKEIAKKQDYQEKDVDVVLSLEDPLSENSVWCGTFNLIWNDLKEKIAKQDIVFNPQLEKVVNLNKGTFTKENLSDNSYVKRYGFSTNTLKREIEEEIKQKFNEKSDILDHFEWTDEPKNNYFLYAMLKKEFTFPNKFTKLKKGNFKKTKNINYFGIDSTTASQVYNQVKVLYYNASNDFAIKLITQEADEVLFVRGLEKNTLKEIWEEIEKREKNQKENKNFQKGDSLKIPYLQLKIKEEITELENKKFYFANKEEYKIEKAIQTISFELNEKGGKIKSEAGLSVNMSASNINNRKFHLEEDFVIFLNEKDKKWPYFAAKVEDIEKFI